MADPVQDSFLWSTSSSGDGSASGYTQSDWTKILQIVGSCHGKEGVADYANHYSASEELETVIIDTGGALVDGKPHECTTAGSVTVVAAAGGGNTRIDRILLRASWNADDASPATVRIVNLAGTDAGTPSAPALTTTSGSTYEIALWQALVNTAGSIALTDERDYGAITTACALGANVITLDKMANNSIDSDQYVDASIDLAHMSASSVDSAQYVDGSIDTTHLANDAVDDTKVGNRVPQLYRRQGSSACAWDTAGSTNYTPTSVRMQVGVITVTNTESLEFPVVFSNVPIVLVTPQTIASSPYQAEVTAISACGISLAAAPPDEAVDVGWCAIGPE